MNTASIAGKAGQPWLAAYSATKAGVVGLSQAMHGELGKDGVQVTAFCPGFVATPMTDWVEGQVPKEEMIQPEDIAEAVRFLLRTSANCVVPEIQFIRPGDVHASSLTRSSSSRHRRLVVLVAAEEARPRPAVALAQLGHAVALAGVGLRRAARGSCELAVLGDRLAERRAVRARPTARLASSMRAERASARARSPGASGAGACV